MYCQVCIKVTLARELQSPQPPTHTLTGWPLRVLRGTIRLFGSVIQRLTLPASFSVLLMLILEAVPPTYSTSPLPFKSVSVRLNYAICLKRK